MSPIYLKKSDKQKTRASRTVELHFNGFLPVRLLYAIFKF